MLAVIRLLLLLYQPFGDVLSKNRQVSDRPIEAQPLSGEKQSSFCPSQSADLCVFSMCLLGGKRGLCQIDDLRLSAPCVYQR